MESWNSEVWPRITACQTGFGRAQSPSASGWVAQLVEQGTENPRVGGSIPSPATIPIRFRVNGLEGSDVQADTSVPARARPASEPMFRRPLGSPTASGLRPSPANAVKSSSRSGVIELRGRDAWLVKASDALIQHWPLKVPRRIDPESPRAGCAGGDSRRRQSLSQAGNLNSWTYERLGSVRVHSHNLPGSI